MDELMGLFGSPSGQPPMTGSGVGAGGGGGGVMDSAASSVGRGGYFGESPFEPGLNGSQFGASSLVGAMNGLGNEPLPQHPPSPRRLPFHIYSEEDSTTGTGGGAAGVGVGGEGGSVGFQIFDENSNGNENGPAAPPPAPAPAPAALTSTLPFAIFDEADENGGGASTSPSASRTAAAAEAEARAFDAENRTPTRGSLPRPNPARRESDELANQLVFRPLDVSNGNHGEDLDQYKAGNGFDSDEGEGEGDHHVLAPANGHVVGGGGGGAAEVGMASGRVSRGASLDFQIFADEEEEQQPPPQPQAAPRTGGGGGGGGLGFSIFADDEEHTADQTDQSTGELQLSSLMINANMSHTPAPANLNAHLGALSGFGRGGGAREARRALETPNGLPNGHHNGSGLAHPSGLTPMVAPIGMADLHDHVEAGEGDEEEHLFPRDSDEANYSNGSLSYPVAGELSQISEATIESSGYQGSSSGGSGGSGPRPMSQFQIYNGIEEGEEN